MLSAKVLSQNVVISQIANEQPKTNPKSAPILEVNHQRAATSIPKKTTPTDPIMQKKTLPSIKSSSTSTLDSIVTPQLPQIPFESLEKQILRDLKPAKGVCLKVASGGVKENHLFDILEENVEAAQERMSRDQYMKLRAEQESSIYNTLKSNYARMSKQQTIYTQSNNSNHIKIVNEKTPISEIEVEKNSIDEQYIFEASPISALKKPHSASSNLFIEPRDFKKNKVIPADLPSITPKEKPEKSRFESETSITFCNDAKLINYFFEVDSNTHRNISNVSQVTSPTNKGSALQALRDKGIDMLERNPQEEYFQKQFNKENNQRPTTMSNVDEKRSGSVVRFAEQTINYEPYLNGTLTDKNKIKMPKVSSMGSRPRDRIKTQVPRLKKMYDYFA